MINIGVLEQITQIPARSRASTNNQRERIMQRARQEQAKAAETMAETTEKCNYCGERVTIPAGLLGHIARMRMRPMADSHLTGRAYNGLYIGPDGRIYCSEEEAQLLNSCGGKT